MMLFERREDGHLWPKPWTRPRPPKQSSMRFFTWQYATALTMAALGTALVYLGETGVGPWLGTAGLIWMVTYTVIDIRRWWHSFRWIHSRPTQPTPEDWT